MCLFLIVSRFHCETSNTYLSSDHNAVSVTPVCELCNKDIHPTTPVPELLGGYLVLSAPVQRCPPEILSEIFLHCMETKRFDPANYEHSLALTEHPCSSGVFAGGGRTLLYLPRDYGHR